MNSVSKVKVKHCQMTTLWFQLKGSTHDEASLRVDNLTLTVDELKEKLLSSNILEVPKDAKKSTIFIYLKGKEESEKVLVPKRRLNARLLLSDLKVDNKTFVVEIAEKKKDISKKKKRTRSASTYFDDDGKRFSKRIKLRNEQNNSNNSKKPCAHTCNDKSTCKHPCCKNEFDDDGYSTPPSSPKKKNSNGPCSHKCIDKRTCGHTCCKKGLDLNSPVTPSPSKKTKKPKPGPCKHNCKDKSSCGHTCCKFGIENAYTKTDDNSKEGGDYSDDFDDDSESDVEDTDDKKKFSGNEKFTVKHA